MLTFIFVKKKRKRKDYDPRYVYGGVARGNPWVKKKLYLPRGKNAKTAVGVCLFIDLTFSN